MDQIRHTPDGQYVPPEVAAGGLETQPDTPSAPGLETATAAVSTVPAEETPSEPIKQADATTESASAAVENAAPIVSEQPGVASAEADLVHADNFRGALSGLGNNPAVVALELSKDLEAAREKPVEQ